MTRLNELEAAALAAKRESPMPSTVEHQEKFADYKEGRTFDLENKGFAERLAAGLNKAVLAREAK